MLLRKTAISVGVAKATLDAPALSVSPGIRARRIDRCRNVRVIMLHRADAIAAARKLGWWTIPESYAWKNTFDFLFLPYQRNSLCPL